MRPVGCVIGDVDRLIFLVRCHTWRRYYISWARRLVEFVDGLSQKLLHKVLGVVWPDKELLLLRGGSETATYTRVMRAHVSVLQILERHLVLLGILVLSWDGREGFPVSMVEVEPGWGLRLHRVESRFSALIKLGRLSDDLWLLDLY